MLRRMLLSKIHRATVTQTDLDYVGSITIDRSLLALTGILENEKVEVFDIDNGNRFETYVIPGEKGMIGVNGAAAHLVNQGDRIIIVNYGLLDETELSHHKPVIVLVNNENEPVEQR